MKSLIKKKRQNNLFKAIGMIPASLTFYLGRALIDKYISNPFLAIVLLFVVLAFTGFVLILAVVFLDWLGAKILASRGMK